MSLFYNWGTREFDCAVLEALKVRPVLMIKYTKNSAKFCRLILRFKGTFTQYPLKDKGSIGFIHYPSGHS
jgi:hypothetical protein